VNLLARHAVAGFDGLYAVFKRFFQDAFPDGPHDEAEKIRGFFRPLRSSL
jgi:hypothetical protein